MKNLIKAIKAEYNKRLVEFTADLKKVKLKAELDKWHYNDLLPKGKKLTGTLAENKEYILARKVKENEAQLNRELKRIEIVGNAPDLVSAKISIEWNKNRTWGACPTGEIWINGEYFTAGGVTGCGYDKLSTIVAKLLNQSNPALKAMYVVKEKRINKSNRDAIAYGAGYGILPSFEGGVGISCYPAIFKACGYNFETVASGKNFDVFTISKL